MADHEPETLIFDLIAQSLHNPDSCMYFNAPRHHELMEHIANSDPHVLRLQARIIHYLQVYIDWSAKQAELMTDLPCEYKDYRCSGLRVREEFYGTEIDYINCIKVNFDYTDELKSTIKKACDNLFDRLRDSGWIDQAAGFWHTADTDLRLAMLQDFTRHFDQAMSDVGVPSEATTIEFNDLESDVVAMMDQTAITDQGSIISLKIGQNYLAAQNFSTMLSVILHEKIHGIFASMAQRFFIEARKDPDGELPWENDHGISYVRRRDYIGSGIDKIISLYLSDAEEELCFDCDNEFGENVSSYLWYKNHAPKLPEAASAAPELS